MRVPRAEPLRAPRRRQLMLTREAPGGASSVRRHISTKYGCSNELRVSRVPPKKMPRFLAAAWRPLSYGSGTPLPAENPKASFDWPWGFRFFLTVAPDALAVLERPFTSSHQTATVSAPGALGLRTAELDASGRARCPLASSYSRRALSQSAHPVSVAFASARCEDVPIRPRGETCST